MKSTWNQYLKQLGPGLITGASDDDPSGIATYSQAGAQFGTLTLWTAFFTFPFMFVIQEMCARIALASSKGLTANIRTHYSLALLYIILLLIGPAILLNIAADLASMSAVAHLLFPAIPLVYYSLLLTIILTFLIIFLSYDSISSVLKYCCLSLMLYLFIPFFSHPSWDLALKNTFLPELKWDKEYIEILVAILGTTISPYMFFWQSTMYAEKRKKDIKKVGLVHLKLMRLDIGLGMFSSNLVMYFIILSTGSVLFQHGIHEIQTVEQAAKALEPLAGDTAYLFFSIGVLGTGFLAIPVLCSTLSYIIATAFEWSHGLNKQWGQAKIFYSIITLSLGLAFLINCFNINPIKALIATAIFYGITAPIMILLILFMANNKKIMHCYINTRWTNFWGGIVFLFMALAAALLIYFSLGSYWAYFISLL